MLIEQSNIPGGLATSLVRGRFEFEATLHGMQGIGPKENPKVIRRFLEESGVETDFVPIPEAYRLIMPKENIDLIIPFRAKEMIDVIENASGDSVLFFSLKYILIMLDGVLLSSKGLKIKV